MREQWPLPPFVFNDGMPEAESDTASHIQGQLWQSGEYVRDFASALDLFDYATRRAEGLKKRADALAIPGDAASHAKRAKFLRRSVPIGEWRNVAARDGAMTIFHFFKNLAAIDEQLRLRCPTLLAALPAARFKTASQLRKKHFKGHELLRNAIGHAAELRGSIEDFEANAFGGFLFYHPVVDGVTFSISIKGEVISYDITEETLRNLMRIQAEIFTAFNEADEVLRDARFRATYRG